MRFRINISLPTDYAVNELFTQRILTNPHSRFVLEKIRIAQPHKKFLSLRGPKIDSSLHKSPRLVPILIHMIPFYFFKICCGIRCSKWSLLFIFANKIVRASLLIILMRASSALHLILRDLIFVAKQ
jgi:hypothetical protein